MANKAQLAIKLPALDPIAVSSHWQRFYFNMFIFTYVGLNKMVDILKTIFLNAFREEMFCILVPIPLKIVPDGPIDNKSALIQELDLCLLGTQEATYHCPNQWWYST